MKEITIELEKILNEDFNNLPLSIDLDPSILEVKTRIRSRIDKIKLLLFELNKSND